MNTQRSFTTPEHCALCEDHPPHFDHALVAVDYAGPWAHLVTALKFGQEPALARALSDLLLHRIRNRWGLPAHPSGRQLEQLKAGAPRLVLPVPLSPQRLRERGYNQAALLAGCIGQSLRVQVHSGLVDRCNATARLMSLSAQDRQLRIRGTFRVSPDAAVIIKDQHIALVDDVLTTGATAGELSRLLLRAGAREVSVWAVARTPTRPSVAA